MGLEVRSIETTVEGDLDLRGTLGLDREVGAGFSALRLRFAVDAPDASAGGPRRAAAQDRALLHGGADADGAAGARGRDGALSRPRWRGGAARRLQHHRGEGVAVAGTPAVVLSANRVGLLPVTGSNPTQFAPGATRAAHPPSMMQLARGAHYGRNRAGNPRTPRPCRRRRGPGATGSAGRRTSRGSATRRISGSRSASTRALALRVAQPVDEDAPALAVAREEPVVGGVVVVDALGGEDREEAHDARAAPRSGGTARAGRPGRARARRGPAAMRSSSCWSRSLSSSSSSSSLEAKWCSRPGSLIPTRLAMVASDAPRKPRVGEDLVGGGQDRVAPLAPLRVSASLSARAHRAGA